VRSVALVCGLVALLLLCTVSCGRREITSEQVRGITREMMAAARKAAGNEAEIDVRPLATSASPKTKSPPAARADQLYISLHNAARLPALQSALDGVAKAHGLERAEVQPAAATPGLARFEFRSGSRRTHTVQIFLPMLRRPSPAPRDATGPRLAIIIDDLGYDRAAAEALFALAYPFTVSVLPNHTISAELAEEARRFGYEVMMHLPMESANGDAKPETVELRVGMSEAEISKTVAKMLSTVPAAIGVNNHQGSRATTDRTLLAAVMSVLRDRKMFFVDSRTTANSVAYLAARNARVPAAARDVFLDDTPTREGALRQLALAERTARQYGFAIAIGHPHPSTLEALAEFLSGLEARGVRLVFVSELVR
jgi:polysaccharide deacetylase 2 family uncharacterized protein YibQ